MSYMITLLGALALLAGCAGPMAGGSASPAFTPEAECERNGGAWRAVHNMCEYQSPGDMR